MGRWRFSRFDEFWTSVIDVSLPDVFQYNSLMILDCKLVLAGRGDLKQSNPDKLVILWMKFVSSFA